MKKRNWKTGLSWALCVFMLLTCFFPVSATALEGAGANPQEKQQSEAQAAGGSQDEEKTSSGDSKQQDAKKDEAAGAKTQQQKKGLLNNTETRAALSSIIAKDKDGNELCYTTLYDSKDRIVDTNDPKKKQDTYYKQKSQGGQGGTIDPGAGLRVYFRMAEIVEHDGAKGVQENTIYYMELPSALIPMEKDKLVETLYIDMCGLESNGSRAGNNSGSSDPAALDAGIEKYEFTFTSQVYDNYNLAGKGYTA